MTAILDAFVVSSAVLVQLCSNLLSYGMVWHERNLPEVERGVVNRLTSAMCLANAAYVTAGTLAVVAMVVLDGLLGPAACDVIVVSVLYFFVVYVTFSNFIAVLSCLYTVHPQAMAALDDAFLYTFIAVLSPALPGYFMSLMWFYGIHRIPMWYRCSSKPIASPSILQESKTNFKLILLYCLVWFLLHVGSFARTSWHRRKTSSQVEPAQPTDSIYLKSSANLDTKNHMLKIQVSIVAILVVVASSYVVIKKRYNTRGTGMVDSAPATLLFMTFVHGVLVQAFFYWRSPKMAQKVLAAFKKSVVDAFWPEQHNSNIV